MKKTLILYMTFFCVGVLTACRGNGGDANAALEAVSSSESRETDAPEVVQPFDQDLVSLYSRDGQSALIIEDNYIYQVKRLYQANEPKECMEETRWWRLQKETGHLEIWDDLEKQSIFDGIVSLDEAGNPVNEKYYNKLLWDGLCRLWDYTEETSVITWIDGDMTEAHMREYENREAFLGDVGFEDILPMYQYYDRYHNLRLELYMDESKEKLCGLVYRHYFNSDRKKCVDRYGFTIDSVEEQDWEGNAAFSLKSVYGTDGADEVEDFQEAIEYTRAGMPDSYKSQGLMEHRREEDGALELVLSNILQLDYVYRDDETLYYRNYTHNPSIFGTTLCSLESYYDERGRVIYESGYITHGQLEYFYIYEEEGDKPEYLLMVDYNGGCGIPRMIRWKNESRFSGDYNNTP